LREDGVFERAAVAGLDLLALERPVKHLEGFYPLGGHVRRHGGELLGDLAGEGGLGRRGGGRLHG
jgi:hypothetical protein